VLDAEIDALGAVDDAAERSVGVRQAVGEAP
jgi:hypothetical protein